MPFSCGNSFACVAIITTINTVHCAILIVYYYYYFSHLSFWTLLPLDVFVAHRCATSPPTHRASNLARITRTVWMHSSDRRLHFTTALQHHCCVSHALSIHDICTTPLFLFYLLLFGGLLWYGNGRWIALHIGAGHESPGNATAHCGAPGPNVGLQRTSASKY